MMEPETSKLFVSFWHLCLDNLPIGQFCHRLISAEDTRALIAQARQEENLHCVSHDDLLAPYCERSLNRHRELREILKSQYGIDITLKDFFSDAGAEGQSLYSVTPLQIAQVQQNQKLLVITCSYEWSGVKGGIEKEMEVPLDSIQFHLFEIDNLEC